MKQASIFEAETRHVIGLSGGKDSTALALELNESEPRDYDYICTPTGDELDEMLAWWDRLEIIFGKKIIRITNPKAPTLDDLIQIMGMLPNNRQRFCTRMLKIEPTIAWCIQNKPVKLYVGLRADEDEREGIYGDHVDSDYPFRRWGWGLGHVYACLEKHGLRHSVPIRTDCGTCYDQKLREWKSLRVNHPTRYEAAARKEDKYGHTFRSPTRDTWPAGLRDLAREFDSGRKLRGDSQKGKCRVCSL